MSRLDQPDVVDAMQRAAFRYFLHEKRDHATLVPDRTDSDSPCSVAGVGYGLAAFAVAAQRGWVPWQEARERVRRTLRRLEQLPQSERAEAAGCRGLFYHFLDPVTGLRAEESEVSTIDSALLFAGALAAAGVFAGSDPEDREIRALAHGLYARADWNWARDGEASLTHGWRPETGFLPNRWTGGFSEGLLLMVLALGSPTHPLPASSYAAFTEGYQWHKAYDISYLYAGPLFIHQLPHVFIDLRGIRDEFMQKHALDYFENARRATYVQIEYAARNPRGFRGYERDVWGFTASDGPGPATRSVGGTSQPFWAYRARGAPLGPDDGTIAPWVAAASLPFAPQAVLAAVRRTSRKSEHATEDYGFAASFNPTFLVRGRPWRSPRHYAINQGPVVLMGENFRSGLLWRLSRRCAPIVRGLRQAGFRGGWLDEAPEILGEDEAGARSLEA
jgi:hypothetical protein